VADQSVKRNPHRLFFGILLLIIAITLIVGIALLSEILCVSCGDLPVSEYHETLDAVYATNTAVARLLEATHAAQTATALSPH
jgi:hypothetical protein